MSEEEDLGFKVVDRRLFNSDGSPRDDAPEQFETPVIAASSAHPVSDAPQDGLFSANAAAQLAPEPNAFADAENSAIEEEQEMTEFIQFSC